MATALIWGASGGIGRALVTALKAHQWQVFGVARHTANIPAEADLSLMFDVDYEHSFEATMMRIAQEVTHIDLMVYAVGGVAYNKLDEMGLSGWNATIRSNLTGAYLAATHSLSLMGEGSHGVFIGAYVDHLRLIKMGAYASAKAGLAEMVTILQKENRKHKFTLVRPGAVNTPFWNQVTFKMPADAKAPQVVAEAIVNHVLAGHHGELNL